MALTPTARKEGVTADGRRSVKLLCTFSDGSAADLTLAVIGLQRVDEVHSLCLAASGVGVDVTANDSTKVTLDPTGAGAHVLTFVGH